MNNSFATEHKAKTFLGLEKILQEENINNDISNDNHFVESDILYQHPAPRNIKVIEDEEIKMQVMDKHNIYLDDDFSDIIAEDESDNIIVYFYKCISEMLH